MVYPKLSDAQILGKRVFLRVDLDVSQVRADDLRLKALVPSVKYLLENGARQIFLAGHMGRYEEGKESKDTKILLPIIKEFFGGDERITILDNLRATKEEEENNSEYAKRLASMADIYVNDAFADSHRDHASIVGVPKLIPGFLGLHFEGELENLDKVLSHSMGHNTTSIIIISGIKEDKVEYAKALTGKFDKVLVGGRLPEYFGEDFVHPKIIMARLVQDKEDITIHSMEKFDDEIKNAKTIVLAGVLGKYEEEGHSQGTKRVFTAVANSSSFKVAGGGDTETALNMFGLANKFDWISVGGGAMLEYLSTGTLQGIGALRG